MIGVQGRRGNKVLSIQILNIQTLYQCIPWQVNVRPFGGGDPITCPGSLRAVHTSTEQVFKNFQTYTTIHTIRGKTSTLLVTGLVVHVCTGVDKCIGTTGVQRYTNPYAVCVYRNGQAIILKVKIEVDMDSYSPYPQ